MEDGRFGRMGPLPCPVTSFTRLSAGENRFVLKGTFIWKENVKGLDCVRAKGAYWQGTERLHRCYWEFKSQSKQNDFAVEGDNRFWATSP